MSEEEKRIISQADFEVHKKETHKQLVQSAVLTFTAFIAIAAVCIAWFINNTSVSGGGVQVQTEGSRFVLASTGTKGRFDTDVSFIEGSAETINTKTYYSTGGTAAAWMLSNESNIKNQAGDESILSPGSSGKITFYIIPKASDVTKVYLNLSLIPYASVETKQDNSLTVQENNKEIYISPLDKTNQAAVYQLLQGHILFFRDKSASGYYSNWVNGKFEIDITNKPANIPIEITLYWVWPLQFKKYVQTGAGNLFENIGTDYTAMQTDMKTVAAGASSNKYFYTKAGSGLPSLTPIGPDMNATDTAVFSAYYNSADEAIGSSTRYFLLELTAAEQEIAQE